jgi:hypothetical protein
LGLLKPKIFWKPLKPEERGRATLFSAADGMAVVLGNIARKRVVDGATPDDINSLMFDEMRKIEALGYGRKTRSDDELRSERQLLRFVDTFNADRSAPPMKELRWVRDTAAFLDLRKKVDDWYARRTARHDACAAWKEQVGDPNRDHLLENGWTRHSGFSSGPNATRRRRRISS